MSPEERKLLERAVALSEENNDILRSVRRSMRLSNFMSLLYWVFIIGSAVGAFYLIQPYLDAISGISGGAKSSASNWKDLLNVGSYAAAREKGLVRIEGKEYVVQDGDVVEFKI